MKTKPVSRLKIELTAFLGLVWTGIAGVCGYAIAGGLGALICAGLAWWGAAASVRRLKAQRAAGK